jgi:predicted phage tail protein
MSPANILVVVLFSLVGLAAFRYGRKNGETSPLVLGVLLMVYGYFTPNVWLSLLVGGLLTALLFYRR